jgi:hypothetical protein
MTAAFSHPKNTTFLKREYSRAGLCILRFSLSLIMSEIDLDQYLGTPDEHFNANAPFLAHVARLPAGWLTCDSCKISHCKHK